MGELVRLTFPDRSQWLAGRCRGIGGSEAAAAIGRSSWKTALTLWKEKTGAQAAPDLGGNEAVELGRRMEPAIRDFFMAQYPGYELYYGAYDILYQSDRPWLFATLDGELTETGTRLGIFRAACALFAAAAMASSPSGAVDGADVAITVARGKEAHANKFAAFEGFSNRFHTVGEQAARAEVMIVFVIFVVCCVSLGLGRLGRVLLVVRHGAEHDLALIFRAGFVIGVANAQMRVLKLVVHRILQRGEIHARPAFQARLQRRQLRVTGCMLVLEQHIFNQRVIDLDHGAGAPAAVGLFFALDVMGHQLQAVFQYQSLALNLRGNVQLFQRVGQQLLKCDGLGFGLILHVGLRSGQWLNGS